MRVLLTGFGPFGAVVDNPSARIVERVARGGWPGVEVVRHTLPDALVIDSDQDAFELSAVAEELSVPLVRISLPSHEARVFRDRRWSPVPLPIDSPTSIRNLLLGELFHASANGYERLPTVLAHEYPGMEP